MTFLFDANNATITGAQAMFKLKTLLVSAGWTVKSSGDGLAAFSSSGDVISSGSAGANGFANTSAWVVVQMPLANSVARQLMFQRSTTNLLWTIKYSYSSGFTGGAPNSTTPGTATDSQTLLNAATLFPTDSTYRWNAGADNASPYGYWSGTFPTLGGNANNAHCMFPLQNTDALDTEPYVFYVDGTASSFLNTNMVSSLKGYMRKGLTGEKFQTVFGSMIWVQTATLTIPSTVGPNPHNGNDDSFPIGVAIYSQSTSWPYGFKGTKTFCQWNGNARTTADTLSIASPGAKDRICYRDCNLPWNGTTPTV